MKDIILLQLNLIYMCSLELKLKNCSYVIIYHIYLYEFIDIEFLHNIFDLKLILRHN